MGEAESEEPPRAIVRWRGEGGLPLVGEAHGSPADPPVLLLHGGGQTRHAWKSSAAALARAGFHAVSLDLRGHGDSGWSAEGRYTLADYVADLRQVLRGLVRPPAVVGASLGGLTALLTEGRHPASLGALVLVDVAHRLEPDGVARVIGFMRAFPDGFATVDEAADAVAAYLPNRARPVDTRGLEKNLRRGDDGRYRWHYDPRFATAGRGDNALDVESELTDAVRRLAIPTLLVRGRMSDVISVETARELSALAPHAEVAEIGDAAHMVAGDVNDVFTAAVVSFLTRVYPARGAK